MKKLTLAAVAAAMLLSLSACNNSATPEETTKDNFVYTTPPLTAVPITDEIIRTTPEETEAAEETTEETEQTTVLSEETTTEEPEEIPVPDDTTVEEQTLGPEPEIDEEVSRLVDAGMPVRTEATEATAEQTIGAVSYETQSYEEWASQVAAQEGWELVTGEHTWEEGNGDYTIVAR